MHVSALELLRCPFCGTRLTLVETSPISRVDEEIISAVLGCECCAYPVVDGIPVLVADDTTRSAMHLLEAGEGEQALLTLLGLEGERAQAFRQQLQDPSRMTYKSSLEVLSPDPEGTYFLYRFSDPTYLMAQSVLEVLEQTSLGSGRAIDLCGGSGHLTRVMMATRAPSEVTLADVFFWKLWLARTFTAPGCTAVCCDANNPLPFRRETFQLVVLSDAFPYIWHKRMLASEMERLRAAGGAIVMPHLHSSLGENFSAGMTLTPASYAQLFERTAPRLFSDRALLDGIINDGSVDLSNAVSAEALGSEPSFTLVASADDSVFVRHPLAVSRAISGELRVNPLYVVTTDGERSILTLTFPNDEYEEEFGESKRYLPERVTLDVDGGGRLKASALGADADRLRRARVVIDAPRRYY